MMLKLVLVLGLGSLLHAAFSAAQYRSYLRVSQQKFTGSLPADIVLQALVSLLAVLYAIVSVTGHFKAIAANDDLVSKGHDSVFSSQLSFATFNHRGRLLVSIGGGLRSRTD